MIISNYLKIRRLIRSLISLFMATYRFHGLYLAGDTRNDQENAQGPNFYMGKMKWRNDF